MHAIVNRELPPCPELPILRPIGFIAVLDKRSSAATRSNQYIGVHGTAESKE